MDLTHQRSIYAIYTAIKSIDIYKLHMGAACLKKGTSKPNPNNPQLLQMHQQHQQEQNTTQPQPRLSSHNLQELSIDPQPQGRAWRQQKSVLGRSVKDVDIRPTSSDFLFQDGEVVGTYKGEPMVQSVCRPFQPGKKEDPAKSQEDEGKTRKIDNNEKGQTTPNPERRLAPENKEASYRKLSTVQEEDSNVLSSPLHCEEARPWDDPLALDGALRIEEEEEGDLESQCEVIPARNRKQGGRRQERDNRGERDRREERYNGEERDSRGERAYCGALDMNLVGDVSDSNSILCSPRLEDLPVKPGEGKVQASQPYFRRVPVFKRRLAASDWKRSSARPPLRS